MKKSQKAVVIKKLKMPIVSMTCKNPSNCH